MVSVAFNDGAGGQMELGRMAEVFLDEDVLQVGEPEEMGDSELTVEEMHQALLAGYFDPTAVLEPSASGPAGVDGGGHKPFVEELVGQETSPGGEEAGTSSFAIRAFEEDDDPADPSEAPDSPPATTSEPATTSPSATPTSISESATPSAPATTSAPQAVSVVQEEPVPVIENEFLELTGEAFGFSSYRDTGSQQGGSENFRSTPMDTPPPVGISGVENVGSAVRVVATGSGESSLRLEGGKLEFTPGEDFSGEMTLGFTLYYNDGSTQSGSLTMLERYLKVGTNANDVGDPYATDDSGDVGTFAVGDGSGAIKGGEAGDILIGDFSGPTGRFLAGNDIINGNGNNDLLFGDSLNTSQVRSNLLESGRLDKKTWRAIKNEDREDGYSVTDSGWGVFKALENSTVDGWEWSRTDTIKYIEGDAEDQGHAEELAKPAAIKGEVWGSSDLIIGGDGEDQIYGQGGGDLLTGGLGDDYINTGGGGLNIPGNILDELMENGLEGIGEVQGDLESTLPDIAFGDEGDDTLVGGKATDILVGGSGDDRMNGGKGSDLIIGDLVDVDLSSEEPLPVSPATPGDDIMQGGNGRDIMIGGGGNDYMTGGNGADVMLGSTGDDTLRGNDGNDLLAGGEGKDWVIGGGGADEIWGGALEGEDDRAVDALIGDKAVSSDGDYVELTPESGEIKGGPKKGLDDINSGEGDIIGDVERADTVNGPGKTYDNDPDFNGATGAAEDLDVLLPEYDQIS